MYGGCWLLVVFVCRAVVVAHVKYICAHQFVIRNNHVANVSTERESECGTASCSVQPIHSVSLCCFTLALRKSHKSCAPCIGLRASFLVEEALLPFGSCCGAVQRCRTDCTGPCRVRYERTTPLSARHTTRCRRNRLVAHILTRGTEHEFRIYGMVYTLDTHATTTLKSSKLNSRSRVAIIILPFGGRISLAKFSTCELSVQ